MSNARIPLISASSVSCSVTVVLAWTSVTELEQSTAFRSYGNASNNDTIILNKGQTSTKIIQKRHSKAELKSDLFKFEHCFWEIHWKPI